MTCRVLHGDRDPTQPSPPSSPQSSHAAAGAPPGYATPDMPTPVVLMMTPPVPPGETRRLTRTREPSNYSTRRTRSADDLPSGRYLEHHPQYFPPDRQAPLSRELSRPGTSRPASSA